MLPIDGDFILRVAPRFSGAKAAAQARIVSAISTEFAPTLDSYQINTPLRIAHFMGQVTHECAGFRTTEEFASGAAYEWREDLGNDEAGDGRKYKGRGLIQLTGKFNYTRMSETLGVDLVNNPERAAEPLLSLKIACEYWKSRDINHFADNDDLISVTKRVNGGLNGLEDRRSYLRRAKTELARMSGIAIVASQAPGTVVLRRGSFGAAVGDLQSRLVQSGFCLTLDDDFGPATELAVRRFQAENGLEQDGIVGERTWAVLTSQTDGLAKIA